MLGLRNIWPNGVAIILKNLQDQSYHLFPSHEEADAGGAKKAAEDNATRKWQN